MIQKIRVKYRNYDQHGHMEVRQDVIEWRDDMNVTNLSLDDIGSYITQSIFDDGFFQIRGENFNANLIISVLPISEDRKDAPAQKKRNPRSNRRRKSRASMDRNGSAGSVAGMEKLDPDYKEEKK